MDLSAKLSDTEIGTDRLIKATLAEEEQIFTRAKMCEASILARSIDPEIRQTYERRKILIVK